jgi:hypothetical protein
MITADSGRTLDWEGGTLDELLGLLGEPALSAYIEAVRPGSGQAVGEIHVVAGGVSETIAGDRRGDDGLSYIKKIPGLRFRVTPAMPNDEGLLLPPPDDEGQLSQRPVTALMRYCEDFVLTCALELARGQETARISYRRGEIVRTLVDGSESSERLPDVMGWNEGTWRIVLPQLNLPRPKKPQRPAPGELGGGTLFGIPAPVIPGLSGGPGTPGPAPMPGMSAAPSVAAPVPAPKSAVPAATPAPTSRPAATPAPLSRPAVTPTPAPTSTPAHTPAPKPAPAPAPAAMASAPATVLDLAPPHMTPARPVSVPSGIARPVADDTRATPPPQVTGPPRPTVNRPAPPRSFASLPLVVHVVLGVALGSAVVAGYWAFLRYGAEIGLR